METTLIMKLQDKEYRDAFVASQINIELPFQVRALREERGWTQSQLAEKAGMLQPRISAIETPGKGKLNLETLLRLASALDVGLVVRFAPFSEMVEWAEDFSPDSFNVPAFPEDMNLFLHKNAGAAISGDMINRHISTGTKALTTGEPYFSPHSLASTGQALLIIKGNRGGCPSEESILPENQEAGKAIYWPNSPQRAQAA